MPSYSKPAKKWPKKLSEFILKNHPYELPALLAGEVFATKEFASLVREIDA